MHEDEPFLVYSTENVLKQREVPSGTPHWFKETKGISYYTVKVIKP